MKAAGNRAARACCARQPVQWAGTITPGFNSASSATTLGMSGSNYRSGQMEAADQGVERLATAEPLGVPGDVDHARVAAAGDHDQAPAADVDDQRLVIEHERVRLPAAVEPGLLRREARLVPAGPRDLAGDQHRPAEQEARLLLLDDVEARLFQRATAGGGNLDRVPAGQDQAAPPPEVGVDQHRHVHLAQRADQPVEPGRVVEMAVATHHGLDAARINVQVIHVPHDAVGAGAGVE